MSDSDPSSNSNSKIWASVIKSKALESEASLHLYYDFHEEDPEIVILKDVVAQNITKTPNDVLHLLLITMLQILSSSDNISSWDSAEDLDIL
tara:strand:+ start:649 stop:924 length:276 start_codon:yes stop_codon:yes gene_type:complete